MAEAEIKAEPTQATRTRSIVTAGNTGMTPVVVAGLLGWIFDIVKSYSPAFPAPSEANLLYLGIAVAAGLSYWSSYSIRGSKVDDANVGGA
jgi:hypothetical protein